MSNRITLKYVTRYEKSIIPYYDNNGALKGIKIRGTRCGYMILLKYFSDDSKLFLLDKFSKGL
jgi:hypothetical protein